MQDVTGAAEERERYVLEEAGGRKLKGFTVLGRKKKSVSMTSFPMHWYLKSHNNMNREHEFCLQVNTDSITLLLYLL
jgi:hypothetical protein